MAKYNISTKEVRKIMKSINKKLDNLNVIQKDALRKKLIEFTDHFTTYVSPRKSIWRPAPSLKHIRTKATYNKETKTWKVEVL